MGDENDPKVTRGALRGYFPDDESAWRRLQPLPEHNCVYVRNTKAGSSTVLLWLHRIHTGDHASTPRNIHKQSTLPRPHQLGWGAVIAMLNGGAFRFSFVRDPAARVESAYRDKIARRPREHAWRERVQLALDLPVDPNQVPTFEQFVAALEVMEPIRMDPHWRPQHLNLMYDLIPYDFIGRLESFDTDLAHVREATGMPEVPLEVRNARPGGDLYDGRPDLLRKVREVYARDFELYGY